MSGTGTFGWSTFGRGDFKRTGDDPNALAEYGLVRSYKTSPPTVKQQAKTAGVSLDPPGKRQVAFAPLVPLGLPVASENSLGGSNFTLSLALIPRGFREREFAQGLAVLYRVSGGNIASGTQDTTEFGYHRPSDSMGLARNWSVLESGDYVPTDFGVLAAQRRGEFVYSVTGKTFQSGQRRVQVIERSNSIFSRERRHHDESIYYEGQGEAASGAPESSFDYAHNVDLFVSDHYPPELYYLSGFSAGKTTDLETAPMAFRWVQADQREFGNNAVTGPFYPRLIFRYEFWATEQDLDTGPADTQPPALVWPWTTPPVGADRSDYAPPEVWFFVPEKRQGKLTQRLKIFRSSYQEGAWRFARGFSRFAPRWEDWDVGGKKHNSTPSRALVGEQRLDLVTNTDYQQRNEDGWAYQGDWHHKDNEVGIVGPFVGLDLDGRQDRLVLRVVRDPRVRGTLHLVAQVADLDQDRIANYDLAWYAVSRNDGKTWSRVKRMVPIQVTGKHQGGGFRTQGALAVLPGGELLGTAYGSHLVSDGKGNQSNTEFQTLVQFNYTGGEGTAKDTSRRPVIFRTGGGGR